MLSSMGMAHTVNALIENELLVVDIALPSQAGQQPLALVLEGPPDFSCNMPFRPLGATLLRWRLLLSCNWRVRPPGLQASRPKFLVYGVCFLAYPLIINSGQCRPIPPRQDRVAKLLSCNRRGCLAGLLHYFHPRQDTR